MISLSDVIGRSKDLPEMAQKAKQDAMADVIACSRMDSGFDGERAVEVYESRYNEIFESRLLEMFPDELERELR